MLFSCVADEQKQSSDVDVDKHVNMLQATVLRVEFCNRRVAQVVELADEVGDGTVHHTRKTVLFKQETITIVEQYSIRE